MASMPEVEQAAQAVLDKFGMAPPVNPISVAKRLGYSVNASIFHEPSLSGRVRIRDGQVRIDVNASDPPNRLRYTIAHEIGHAILHLVGAENAEMSDRGEVFKRQLNGGLRAQKEVEADRFAGALLMPEKAVRERFAQNPAVDSLAAYFQVSPQAMQIRLEHLNLA